MKTNHHILIVDDNPENIQLLANYLSENQYKMSFSMNGIDALSITKGKKIDLILLDIMMPEINGFRVCEILKRNSKTRDIPIIFITAKTDSESVAKAFALGAVDYISKPFSKLELLARLKTQLDLKDNTSLLASTNKKLKTGYKRELRQRKKNEVLLKQQSKLALMGEMLFMIAHQWKQPISVINSSVADLYYKKTLNQTVDNSLKDHFEIVQDQTHKMTNIIAMFLNFTSPDKEIKKFSLEVLLDEIEKLFGKELQNQNIQWIREGNANLTLKGYRNELEQVLINLVCNAKEAYETHQGNEKVIKFTILNETNNVTMYIEDNAGGILPKNTSNIFKPYFTTKKKGSGVGLYISKNIIENSFNGFIHAESLKGGTRMKITLPH